MRREKDTVYKPQTRGPMKGMSGDAASMQETDAELRELMRFAAEELGPRGRAGEASPGSGELDDRALSRRNESILRFRRGEEDDSSAPDEVGERFRPVGSALDPPVRFVRTRRVVPPDDSRIDPELERRSLIVSSVYPSFRAVTPQARTVRWGRKRKPEVTWDNVARPAHQGGRLERAKAFAGSVAYI